ncbi:FAD-binding protein [Staphylococcus aureus]|nr:FAD-binding protein [Staphylococcus aureus]MBH4540334.1 FAD-binding protein [Staphylococcus aureus]MBH4545069.1 FAD-binding protein [Staphylococcus aureus]MBH4551771.1 FAD-binding protein [Staphylococcus aureus]MBH4554316.1 FAD-binding protein [Staphylococcus aureus]
MIIVGTGITGLIAAYQACKKGIKVNLLTKKVYSFDEYTWSSGGGCSWKTHAFNVATGTDDNPHNHFLDTMQGGSNLNNPILAKVLCDEHQISLNF